MTVLETRNASLQDLVVLLRDQHARHVDVVVPAGALRAEGGQLAVPGVGEATLTPDGVTAGSALMRLTDVAEEGLAAKLNIPLPYLRRMRAEHPELWDRNVNGWLGHTANTGRRFLVRGLRGTGDNDGRGVARAFLSDGYKIVDNLDVLMAALDGVRRAGAPVDIDGCDLTDRRMYVRVRSEAVRALAPALLHNYRSPFTGAAGADNPTVFAGFVISNSETGCGAFTITPRLVVQVCTNGMTITADALRAVHLGGRLDEGVIRWSSDTERQALGLVTAKTRDAVATFLDPAYLHRQLDQLTETAGTPVANPVDTIETVSKALKFSTEQQALLLDHFVRGGDPTAGGVLHAVTSAAQTMDADTAHDMEAAGARALTLAARA